MTAQENKTRFGELAEALWKDRNLDVLDDVLSPKFVGHAKPANIYGPQGLKNVAEMFFAAFPDWQVELNEVVAEGDIVATRWTGRGTHKGVFEGFPPTDQEIKVEGMAFVRFEDDRIVEAWPLIDFADVIRQIGM